MAKQMLEPRLNFVSFLKLYAIAHKKGLTLTRFADFLNKPRAQVKKRIDDIRSQYAEIGKIIPSLSDDEEFPALEQGLLNWRSSYQNSGFEDFEYSLKDYNNPAFANWITVIRQIEGKTVYVGNVQCILRCVYNKEGYVDNKLEAKPTQNGRGMLALTGKKIESFLWDVADIPDNVLSQVDFDIVVINNNEFTPEDAAIAELF